MFKAVNNTNTVERACRYEKIDNKDFCAFIRSYEKKADCLACEKDFCNGCSGADGIYLHVWLFLFSIVFAFIK